MSHYSEADLEALKRANPLADIVRHSGCELKKHGINKLACLCVFHEEKTPSCVIDTVRNSFKCFGCGKSGDVITWVMETEGLDFVSAVKRLRPAEVQSSKFKVQSPKQEEVTLSPCHPVTLSPLSPGMTGREMLNAAVGFYHRTAKASPELLAYLNKRGLLPDTEEAEILNSQFSILNYFKLGYANRTLGLQLPSMQVVAGKQIRSSLQEIGILRESGHEHFNGSLTIPIFDEAGNAAEIYGRKIRDDLRPGTPKHLYLPGPHKGIWNAEAFTVSKTVILCESLIDALTFWVHGFQNVTACYGINGFTEEMLEAFIRHQVEAVYIAFDRDEAGDRGAAAVAEKLIAHNIACYRVQFPKGMDANEYALRFSSKFKVQSSKSEAAEALGELLRSAQWIGGSPKSEVPSPAEVPSPESEVRSPAESEEIPSRSSENQPSPVAEMRGEDVYLMIGDREYRIRGVLKNLSAGVLKVNLRVLRGEAMHQDSLDLCSNGQRRTFARDAAAELKLKPEALERELKRVLMAVETVQDEQIKRALEPKAKPVHAMTETEGREALEYLKSPDLMERLLEDFKTCGVVGEETNLLVGYLGAVSRKLEKPLGILIQSSSAAGKTSLMDAVLGFIPAEDMVRYSAMTGQSLFYIADGDLQHKILAIAEEEGAKQAGYSLKLLQSEGRISIASTGKDPNTGRHVTHDYEVRGPVMLFSTSTRVDIDEELLNRCIVLSVNEDRDQTRAIHAHQRRQRTLEGLRARSRSDRLRQLHRNAQRLLRPLTVVNPFADRLTFLDDKTRTRRDHEKYLTLIDALALLRQHRRPVRQDVWDGARQDYVEVAVEDIALANRLANEVLGRSLDELPPHTRRLLVQLDEWAAARCRELQLQRDEFHFTRRQVREALGWHDTQLRMHLERLTELEYVLIHRGGRGQQFVYELLYEGQGRDGTPFVLGLLDVERLRADTAMTVTSRGEGQGFAPSKRAENGGVAPGSRPAVSLRLDWDFHRIGEIPAENAVLGRRAGGVSSYLNSGPTCDAAFQV